jgi:hypothetical protein
VNQKQLQTTFGHPTPELPVEDVERAQQHYRDALGFEIGWLYPGGDIGAVSRDNVPIFFRRRSRPFEPAVTLKELRRRSLIGEPAQLLQSCEESFQGISNPGFQGKPWAGISQRFQRKFLWSALTLQPPQPGCPAGDPGVSALVVCNLSQLSVRLPSPCNLGVQCGGRRRQVAEDQSGNRLPYSKLAARWNKGDKDKAFPELLRSRSHRMNALSRGGGKVMLGTLKSREW